uniref:G-protein coupled receptors family 1 profile domain-containing protein n=1 Tax=Parascaris equorum TaxID=6256 RepID=A0A914S051_PAREQ
MIMSGGACEIGSVPLPNITWLISAIAQFDSSYGTVHPYIALFLCVVGTLMNLVTVIVLTRPSMISPVNVLLCSVALCDVIVMASYLIFVSHFLIGAANRCDHNDYSFAWAVFTLFHAHTSVIFHSTSIWLTVSIVFLKFCLWQILIFGNKRINR